MNINSSRPPNRLFDSSPYGLIRFIVAVAAILATYAITMAVIQKHINGKRPAAVQLYDQCMSRQFSGMNPSAEQLALVDKCNANLSVFLQANQRNQPQGYLP